MRACASFCGRGKCCIAPLSLGCQSTRVERTVAAVSFAVCIKRDKDCTVTIHNAENGERYAVSLGLAKYFSCHILSGNRVFSNGKFGRLSIRLTEI